jgi:hypothetical protein
MLAVFEDRGGRICFATDVAQQYNQARASAADAASKSSDP